MFLTGGNEFHFIYENNKIVGITSYGVILIEYVHTSIEVLSQHMDNIWMWLFQWSEMVLFHLSTIEKQW